MVYLTTNEQQMLRYLVARPAAAVSRDDLHAEIWGHAPQVISRAAEVTAARDAEHVLKELDDDMTAVAPVDGPGEIWQALHAQPLFIEAFEACADGLVRSDGVLGPAAALAVYEVRADQIVDAVVLESARWGDNQRPEQPYTLTDWQAELDWLRDEYFEARTAIVRAQLGLPAR